MSTFVFPQEKLLNRNPSSQLAEGICFSPGSQLALLVAGQEVGECGGSQESQTHLESAEISVVESKMHLVESVM